MGIREDYYARTELKNHEDKIVSDIRRLQGELNQIRYRIQNSMKVRDDWEGILLSDKAYEIGSDSALVYTIPESDQEASRHVKVYYRRNKPSEWVVQASIGPFYQGSPDVYGWDKDWDNEKATECAKAWLRNDPDFLERFGKSY